METETPTGPPKEGRKAWFFSAEGAKEARRIKAEKRKALGPQKSLDAYRPTVPAVSDEASRALLPKILTDEITFRSELLATIREMQTVIVHSVREEFYDKGKQTLPQLVTALNRCVELSLKIVDGTKGLDLTNTTSAQVTGLFAKAAILRGELMRMGIMDREGNYKRLPGTVAEATAGDPTSDDDASADPAGAPPPAEEGVL